MQVVYEPREVSFCDLLKVFWESHDPTQGFGTSTCALLILPCTISSRS